MSTYVTKKIRNSSFLISVLIFLKSKQKSINEINYEMLKKDYVTTRFKIVLIEK